MGFWRNSKDIIPECSAGFLQTKKNSLLLENPGENFKIILDEILRERLFWWDFKNDFY